jgi:hypothetical protein
MSDKTEFKVEVGKEEFTPQHPYPDIWYDDDQLSDDDESNDCITCGLDLNESICNACWEEEQSQVSKPQAPEAGAGT